MKQIALALNQYRQDHNGVAPRHFSELVPNYISTPKMFFMQSKYNTSTCVIPANLDSQPELIDIFSPYSFIVLPDQRILVSERPGMWMDNTMSFFYWTIEISQQTYSRAFEHVVSHPKNFNRDSHVAFNDTRSLHLFDFGLSTLGLGL